MREVDIAKVAEEASLANALLSQPQYHMEKGTLYQRVGELIGNGSSLIAVIAEPGMGKTAFLRDIQGKHPGSPLVSVRRALGTNKPAGFWTAILNQLGIKDKRVPATVQEMADLAAETLRKSKNKPLLVLIDCMEEGAELIDSRGVAGLDFCIDQVAVIVATRPGAEAEALVASGAAAVRLDSHSEENLEELASWLTDYLGAERREAVGDIVAKSEGNFFVASSLARAIKNNTLAVHDLDVSPQQLRDVYSSMLDSLVLEAPIYEQDDVVSVLCLLAEAGEPLQAVSLADFLGLTASKVRRILLRVAPVVRCEEQRYSLFNKRFSEMVTKHYSRDLVKVHQQVITYFRVTFPTWEEMDDLYGWFYLGHHCDRLARVSRRCDFSALHMLGEGSYVTAKLNYTRSIAAVLQDLKRCLRASIEEKNLSRIVGYGLRIPRLRAMHSANGLHDLADLGLYDLALERARLLRAESSRLKAYLLLAWQADSEGCVDTARQILSEARDLVLPDIGSEDRMLVAFILAHLLKNISLAEVLSVLFNCTSREQVLRVIVQLGTDSVLDVAKRREVLRRGLDYALSFAEDGFEASWRPRLQALIEAVDSEDEAEADSGADGRLSGIHDVPCDYGDNEAIAMALEHLEHVCQSEVINEAHPAEAQIGEAEDDEAERSEEGQKAAAAEHTAKIKEAYHAALELVSNVRWESRKVGAIAALTKVLINHSDADWVSMAFEELIGVVVSVHLPEERQKATIAITRLITGRARNKGWRDVFEHLSALIETFEDARLRVRALAWLALAYYESRDFKGALSVLNQAASLAFHISDTAGQANELAMLASMAVAINHPNIARNLAYHYIQVYEAPAKVRVDTEVRAALVVGASANVSEERSLEYLNSSIQAAQEIPDMRVRADLLVALAGGVAKLGETDWAKRVQSQALGVARAMEPGATQAKTLARLAIQEYEWGEVYKADQICQEAETAATEEDSLVAKREALMAVAVAARVGGNEDKARELLQEVISCLESISYEELAGNVDIVQLATLATEVRQRGLVVAYLNRLNQELLTSKGLASDNGFLTLVEAWLVLGENEKAREALLHIGDVGMRIKGRIVLAKGFIRSYHEEAVDLLARIPVFSERMRGVRECLNELMRSSAPGAYARDMDKVLAELTMLAVDDEMTADLVLGRWISLSTNRQDIIDCVNKLGYSVEDLHYGNIVAPVDDAV
ncbi:ATP-binding protein [bacterium]|nr:ATP-binding protein [bacterium]